MTTHYINYVTDLIEAISHSYIGGVIDGRTFRTIFHDIHYAILKPKMSKKENLKGDQIIEEKFDDMISIYANDIFEYYESDPKARSESKEFFGDEELQKRVEELLKKIQKFHVSSNLQDLYPW